MNRAIAIAVALCLALVGGAFLLAARGPRVLPTGVRAPLTRPLAARVSLRSRYGSILAQTDRNDGAVRLLDVRTLRTLRVIHLGDQVTSLHFSKNGETLYATVRDDAHVRAIDLRTGAILAIGER